MYLVIDHVNDEVSIVDDAANRDNPARLFKVPDVGILDGSLLSQIAAGLDVDVLTEMYVDGDAMKPTGYTWVDDHDPRGLPSSWECLGTPTDDYDNYCQVE